MLINALDLLFLVKFEISSLLLVLSKKSYNCFLTLLKVADSY